MKKEAQNVHEHIRIEAFLLSEKAGHPTGMDGFFWTQAESIVHGRAAVVVGPGKPKAKPKAAPAVKEKAVKKTVSAKTAVLPKAGKAAKPKAKPVSKRAK